MKKDKTYSLLLAKMHEVTILPPQDVGLLTPLYKKVVPQFKFYPLKSAIVLSLILVFFLYIILGPALVKVATLLQYGF